MDSFIVGMIIYAAVISAPFVVYMVVVDRLRWKRIMKHQKEWNEIKKTLPNDQQIVFDAFYKYCDKLWAGRHPILGACFPRM